ncbi:MAG TPA: hypothetical protein VG371_10990 [Solirubrobacteraceae bacterium]|nr:hypothetical protein [Solirubrobacteraceae bacterium]
MVRAIVIRRCPAWGAAGGLILSPAASLRCPVRGAMVGRILSPMPIRITLTRARELAPSRKRALE